MKEYFETTAKYLILDIPVPYTGMLNEAQALKHRYTDHRGEEKHQGWKSLALYGLDEHLHENWEDYGYATPAEAARDFKWTAAAKECPITMDFLQNTFPCKKYGRVRFMLLEAGGYIGMHNDSKSGIRLTENINIPLNNPKECIWKWGDGSPDLFMQPGNSYAMNISYDHAIYNNSNEDRYHLIVARHDATDEWKKLITEAADHAGEIGRFITINALP
jgi:Aspartyl/Asparaginyl beta-hydroxylase